MSLYCLKHKSANKKCKCAVNSLISVTDNMIPVALIADSLGLQVASAFSIKEPYDLVGAYLYFKCLYPEVLLQELPTGWYLSDYVTVDNQALCSCLAYECVMSLDAIVASAINDLLSYLGTRTKNGLMAVLTLLES